MIDSNDSSDEMHDETLSSEEVERLINGASARPDLAELSALLGDVRALPGRVGLPAVSIALSEFVGVDLTPTPEPIVLIESDDTPVASLDHQRPAEPVRRHSMIGQLAAFLGTMGGKVVIGTTVAAASLGGVHASGMVDVPFLPDQTPAEIETIDLPPDPDALAFVEEDDDQPEEAAAVEEAEEKDVAPVEDDEKHGSDWGDVDLYLDSDDDYPKYEKELEEDEVDHEKVVEEKEPVKTEEPKKEEPKQEKPDAEKVKQAQIGALEEEVHRAKDAVRAEATALIRPLEEERDGLLADLEATHHALAVEWEGVIDSLLADLEGTEDAEARVEIESQIHVAEESWAAARVEAEVEVDPRLNEINHLFEVIETERDAEIDRLLAEFRKAVEAIENS